MRPTTANSRNGLPLRLRSPQCRRAFFWGAGLLGIAAVGCQSTEKIRLDASGAPEYERLHVVYDVKSRSGLVRLDQPGSLETGVQTASHTDAAAAKTDAKDPNARLRLEIEYPYPGLLPEFAHATLRVVDGKSEGRTTGGTIDVNSTPPRDMRGFSNANRRNGGLLSPTVGPPVKHAPKPGEEILVIDLPKTEINPLLIDLASDGFFKSAGLKEPESHLEVTYNQGEVVKDWHKEPRLEKLVEMLQQHGKPSTVQAPAKAPLPGYYTSRYGAHSDTP